ncbi:MAG: hypothetical protein K2J01_06695 [Clostridiales bacterium]|nr:hypothetical protein [Clostridiales bacterium]
MANKTIASTTQQDGKAKELVVDARFVMRSYEQKDDKGNKTTKEYLSFELIEPFGSDELFKDVPLKAKWDKYDEKTNRLVRPDRVFEYMSYYARKALRSAPEVHVKVTIKPVKYKSKKSGDMVTYAAMFADPTFVELEEEKAVEVVVKGAQLAIDFELLAGKALGIKFTSNPDPYDSGLMDD